MEDPWPRMAFRYIAYFNINPSNCDWKVISNLYQNSIIHCQSEARPIA